MRVSLTAGDGAGPWWIAIQNFGPLYLEQIGFGATSPQGRLERISLLMDGSVSMFGLTGGRRPADHLPSSATTTSSTRRAGPSIWPARGLGQHGRRNRRRPAPSRARRRTSNTWACCSAASRSTASPCTAAATRGTENGQSSPPSSPSARSATPSAGHLHRHRRQLRHQPPAAPAERHGEVRRLPADPGAGHRRQAQHDR